MMWAVFWRDLWTPVWPNLAASVIWTIPVVAWHHRRIKAHITAATTRPADDNSPLDGTP